MRRRKPPPTLFKGEGTLSQSVRSLRIRRDLWYIHTPLAFAIPYGKARSEVLLIHVLVSELPRISVFAPLYNSEEDQDPL